MTKIIFAFIIGLLLIFFGYRTYSMSYTSKFFTSFTKKFLSVVMFFVGLLILVVIYYGYKLLSGFA